MRKIVIHATLNEDLIKKWKALWKISEDGHFFNTPEWLQAYCTVYSIKKYTVVTIEEEGALVLVLPLVLEKMFDVSTWCSPGGKFLSKSSLLTKTIDKPLLDMIIDYLMKQGNFYLRELSLELADALSKVSPDLVKKEASVSPYFSISSDTFQQFPSKLRTQIRGILRKNDSALQYKAFRGDADALQVVFELDEKSTKKKQGKGTFVTEKDRRFCRELLQKMPHNFVIDMIYYENKPVIYGIGFEYKKTFHAYSTAFDDNYRYLRPGKLLTYFGLKRLQEEKYEIFDFGRGENMLKQEFTKVAKAHYDIFYTPNPLTKLWWNNINRPKSFILEHKSLYGTYLAFKRLVAR